MEFTFVLFCFVLFCFVLFCFVLFCWPLQCSHCDGCTVFKDVVKENDGELGGILHSVGRSGGQKEVVNTGPREAPEWWACAIRPSLAHPEAPETVGSKRKLTRSAHRPLSAYHAPILPQRGNSGMRENLPTGLKSDQPQPDATEPMPWIHNEQSMLHRSASTASSLGGGVPPEN